LAPVRHRLRHGDGRNAAAEHACAFDRSELYSDEATPIGVVDTDEWPEARLRDCGVALAVGLSAADPNRHRVPFTESGAQR
jgi:hypothetical protein